MIAGNFSLAKANASRTNLAPSPMNICTSWGPANFKNVALVWAAQARASRVFPVPGGPYRRTPFGGATPKRKIMIIDSQYYHYSSFLK